MRRKSSPRRDTINLNNFRRLTQYSVSSSTFVLAISFSVVLAVSIVSAIAVVKLDAGPGPLTLCVLSLVALTYIQVKDVRYRRRVSKIGKLVIREAYLLRPHLEPEGYAKYLMEAQRALFERGLPHFAMALPLAENDWKRDEVFDSEHERYRASTGLDES